LKCNRWHLREGEEKWEEGAKEMQIMRMEVVVVVTSFLN
jgi:hypothetical protein